MHIKSLKIQGFKSYRDETIVDPFSPHLNVLVGRNGSGKSNFFGAIRFVLSDAYTNMSREERQALLHDGTTGGTGLAGQTMSAFVEIEFDNQDGRFPTGKSTVLLRRTIGQKKDEYQLDRKSVSKGEVMSLLESAGFSRSNPYYIVPQGRVTHLTNQKDHDRLTLLKEVAGTKVYEEKRAESTTIIDATNAKREKIKDTLETINERLAELEEEKEELKEFQTADRERRSLEYAIYQRELKEVGDQLESLEDDHRRDVDLANTRRQEYTDRQKEIAEMDASIAAARQRLELLEIEHKQTSAERADNVKAKAQIDCIIRDAEHDNKRGQARLDHLREELEAVEEEIKEKEVELMEALPAWEDKLADEVEQKAALDSAETSLRLLYAKRGRANQFKSQKDRDAHLRKEIENRQGMIKTRKQREVDLKRDIAGAKRDQEDLAESAKRTLQELAKHKEQVKTCSDEIAEIKDEESTALEERKLLWKEESRVDSQAKHAEEQLKKAESHLARTMDRDTANGLRAAARIAERLGLEGYFGPLYELFTCDERYKTAVEVTAGTSLFQIVVDTDATATRILDVMIKEKSGRVTFVPLNRLKAQNVDYPQANEAIPMIRKLHFDNKYKLAMEQVFGKTLICQSLEVCGAFTRSCGLNTITLDGDKYDRKGSLTGGYHDSNRSRLDAVKNLRHWQLQFEQEDRHRREVKEKVAELGQKITQLAGRRQVAMTKRQRAVDERDPLTEQAMTLQAEESRAASRAAQLEHALRDSETNSRNLELEVAGLEKELKTKMEQNLTTAESEELDRLQAQIEQTKKSLATLSGEVAKLASTKSLLELELNENLRRRRDELKVKLDSAETSDTTTSNEDVNSRRKEVKQLTKVIEQLASRLDELDGEMEDARKEILEFEAAKEKKEGQQSEETRTIDRQQKSVERYLAKRQLLLARKDECNKNIRDLGVLPEEAFEENKLPSTKLLKKLRKVTETLKGFAHVNKKAFDQYSNYTKQRDELIARQKELDNSYDSIKELIDVLDQRKNEAIERTFKQVAKNFSEVFEKLVPAGRGRLIMLKRQTRADDEMDVDGEGDDEPEGTQGVDAYTGVTIRVSFNSKSNEGLKLQQLSGGQKALVALAMIFAIQKCDPAPFYLFDEIDANLDADRRTGVAAMVSELSQDGQYICTTFRPELVQHADAYFGVIFNNTKISNVKAISADECMGFIDAADQVQR